MPAALYLAYGHRRHVNVGVRLASSHTREAVADTRAGVRFKDTSGPSLANGLIQAL